MCNKKTETRYTREDVAKAFGLASTEMSHGELAHYSAQLEKQQQQQQQQQQSKAFASAIASAPRKIIAAVLRR